MSYETGFVLVFHFRKRLFTEDQIFVLISLCFGRSQCNKVLDRCCVRIEKSGRTRSDGEGRKVLSPG